MATNVLSDRLARLEANGLVTKSPDPSDRRRNIYRLTEPGKDLLPILVEMIVWSAKYDPSSAVPPALVERAHRDRSGLIDSLRERIEPVDDQY